MTDPRLDCPDEITADQPAPDPAELSLDTPCIVCGVTPSLVITEMCPVCTFGSASALEDFPA